MGGSYFWIPGRSAIVSRSDRHKMIASYFEDEIAECKTFCDNCTKGEVELIDVSVDAQKFLSAVYRSQQRFGQNYIGFSR